MKHLLFRRSLLGRLVIFLLASSWFLGLFPLPWGLAPTIKDSAAQLPPAPGAVIKITSPTSGSVINDFQVLVRGTLVVLPGTEVGVTVNGFAGLADTGQFAAIVPVDAQVTSLTATARGANGNVLGSDAVAVSVQVPTAESTLFFRPSPVMGIAPFTASFTLTSLQPIALITLDADGNGTPDFVGTSLEGQTFTYNLPGLYFPKVTVVDTANNTYTETSIVQALTQSGFDSFLKAKWTGMKNALRNNDIVGALNYIVTSKRSSYQAMFNALTVPLTSIDQVLTDIVFVKQSGSAVEYEMLRSDAGSQFSYMVLFVLDQDGIWRIKFL